MNRLSTILASILAAASLSAAQAHAGGYVVLELFQSQGCSSCPPANANVNALSMRGDVLALSFAVTYWDRLGWRDTFAKPEFTKRQYDYAHGLGNANVYTPQIVLNGRHDLSGINRGQLEGAMTRAARVPAHPLSLSGDTLSIAAAARPRAPADIWLVRYDPRTIEVPIQAGENGGRTLPHKNIVRELARIGGWDGRVQTHRLPPAAAGLRTAILIQQTGGGPILAALAP
jgi:hypothetical protein